MNNVEIKDELKAAKIPYWKIADIFGVHENTIARKLRHELTDSDKTRFESAIALVKAEKSRPSDTTHPNGSKQA